MKIYLGVPYSDPNESVMEARFDAVTEKTGELMNEGHIVYSPITACHPVAKRCTLPRTWDFWEKLDRTFIDWAEEVWILQLDGWKESTGVNAEIKIAKELGKPVKYVEPSPVMLNKMRLAVEQANLESGIRNLKL